MKGHAEYGLICSPLLAGRLGEGGGGGGTCNGQILSLIKNVTHVPSPGGIAFLPADAAHIQILSTWAQEESLEPYPSVHMIKHHSPGSTTQPKLYDSLGHQ